MANLGVSFYINLLSVIATTYILTWYILTPSPNQCQMTFMMEPPKFIPIEVEQDTNHDEQLIYPAAIKKGGAKQRQNTNSDYKLYMYSEYGFPMASDVRRDLRDSMPVLFVPGNAGSYQQVRSLASTCIRRQLQSLDAFKFIFYTIDFGGQFSGMSGYLIDRQTLFVQRALRQIIKMHPSDTEGAILIGHSVGGFISKFLFTKPNFQPSSVPLMISLASPLTRPYLMLDDKMAKIYRETERYWNKTKSLHDRDHDTIAISISGGGTDRLVPMHLSLDSSFDLSLTTESMKDVFMSTDHVSVTWCRELMHKLANLLSTLMDRKQTRLIPGKSLKMSIIENELLHKRLVNFGYGAIPSTGDWTTRRASEILNLGDTHQIYRNQLKDNIYIFKKDDNHDSLIIVDHIDTPRASTVFGCSDAYFNSTNKQITCQGRSDLTVLFNSIPTSRYEPRRSIIRLTRSVMSDSSINNIGFDFTGQPHKTTGPPEMITIQKFLDQKVSGLRIPCLLESLVRKMLFLPIRIQLFPRFNLTSELFEVELSGSQSANSALSIALVTSKCLSKGKPTSATLIYYKNGYMEASSYLTSDAKNQQTYRSEMKLRDSIMRHKSDEEEDKSYIDVYLDGTCENVLEIEVNPLNLAANMLQTDLGTMLSCLTFLVTCSIVDSSAKLANHPGDSVLSLLIRFGSRLFGSLFVVIVSRLIGGRGADSDDWTDYSTSIALTLIFTYGLLSFSIYFIRRLIDLATIINNTRIVLRSKVAPAKEKIHHQDSSSNNGDVKKNGSHSVENNDKTIRETKTDLEWPIIGLAIASGPFLSSIPLNVLSILLLIIRSLRISSVPDSSDQPTNQHCCDHKRADQRAAIGRDMKNDLLVNLIMMSSLVLLVNIPDLLLKLKTGMTFIESTDSSNVGAEYAAISLLLILVKLICDQIESGSNEARSRWMRSNFLLRALFTLTTSKFTHTLTLIPIISIESNIRLATTVALLTAMWLLNYLKFNLVNSTTT